MRLALVLAGQVVGNAILPGIGGAIGGALGGALGAALTPQPTVKGPQLTDLETTTASEGTVIPIMWGSMRVVGQILWAPKLTRNVRKTSSGGKGSSGPTVETEYATGSWALSFGYNRSGIPRTLRRVWANKKIIFDATGSGGVVRKAGIAYTYYDGTQTVPDATMESLLGAGNVSAYTGQALMVFEDQNLEQWGNGIPSIEVELVDNAESTTSLEITDLSDHGYLDAKSISNGNMYYDDIRGLVWFSFLGGNSSTYAAVFVVNPHTRQIVWKRIFSEVPGNIGGAMYLINHTSMKDRVLIKYGNSGTTYVIYDPSNFAYVGAGGTYRFGNNGAVAFTGILYGYWASAGMRYFDGAGTEHVVSIPSGHLGSPFYFSQKIFAVDNHGARTVVNDEAHMVLKTTASPARFAWFEVNPPSLLNEKPTLTTVVSAGAYASATLSDGLSGMYIPNGNFAGHGAYCGTTGTYFFPFSETSSTDAYIAEVVPDTGLFTWYKADARLGTTGFGWMSGDGFPYLYFDEESRNLWFTGYNAGMCWWNVVSKQGKAYSGVPSNSPIYFHNQSARGFGMGQNILGYREVLWNLSIDEVSQEGIAVASVIRDVCVRNGVASTAVQFTGITDTITGAVANQQMSGRSMIDPLLQYAFSDGHESEYLLKFVKRGGAVATTLSEDYIGAVEGGAEPNSTSITLPHHLELPKAVDVRFFNAQNGYQVADAHYAWFTSESERTSMFTMPIAITPDQAIDRASKLLHSMYQHAALEVTCGPHYAAVEPTDVIDVPLNARVERVRVGSIRRGVNGLRTLNCTVDSERDGVAYVSAAATDIRGELVESASPQLTFWLDTNLLQDIDSENPGPYVALYDYASGFDTGFLFTSPDNNAYAQAAQFDAEPAYGIVQSYGTAAASVGGWDTTNDVTVAMIDGAGTLSSISSTALFAGGNAAAWGKPGRWEVVQYLSVAVASSGNLVFSSLLRGRRGSDNYITTHEASDWFVVLDEAAMARLNYAVADVGNAVYARAVPSGESYINVSQEVFTVSHNAIRPYSPHETVASASVAAFSLAWEYRTRSAGVYGGIASVTDGVAGTLSDPETAEIRTYTSAGALISVVSATGDSHVYEVSTLKADLGFLPRTFNWRVAQTPSFSVVSTGFWSPAHVVSTTSLDYAAPVYDSTPEGYWRLGGMDPHWSDVVLLMHMDGTHTGTVFGEETGKTVTRVSVYTSTTQKVFGPTSAYFGGAWYLTLPDSTDWDLQGSDFTIELRSYIEYWPSAGQWRALLGWYDQPTESGWALMVNDVGRLWLFSGVGGSGLYVGSAVIQYRTWQKIVICGTASGAAQVFVDDVLVATTLDWNYPTPTGAALHIGARNVGAYYWYGYIDELRITKGTARYTVEEPYLPNSPFPDGSVASAVCYDEMGALNGAFQGSVTFTSSTPLTPYDDDMAAVFDGSAAYASATDAGIVLGNVFTVTGWGNREATTTGAERCMLSQWTSTGTARCMRFGISSTNKPYLKVSGDGTDSNVVHGEANASITVDSWNMITAVFSTGDVDIYVNGSAVAVTITSTGAAASANYASATWNIAAFDSGSQGHFDGVLDEIDVLASGLTAADVLEKYNGAG